MFPLLAVASLLWSEVVVPRGVITAALSFSPAAQQEPDGTGGQTGTHSPEMYLQYFSQAQDE